MRALDFMRVGFCASLLTLSLGCSARSKVETVIQGFFSEVNKSNFETAKSQYLATPLVNTLNSPGAPHNRVQKSFEQVVGQVKSVDVGSIEVKGETATARAFLAMPWGTKYQGKIELIKEGGRDWKISDWDEFTVLGHEHTSRGMQYCQSRERNNAVAEFQAALSENSRDATIFTGMGNCYLLLGDLSAAEAELKKAVDMYPDVVWDPYLLLAQVYQKKGSFPQAEGALEKAIKNKPDYAVAYNNLAWLYAENGTKLDRAIELAQKALRLSPNDPNILDTLGWAYYRKGDRAQAVEYLARASGQAPFDQKIQAHYREVSTTAATHVALAQQFLQGRQYEEAIAECEAALRMEPGNVQAHDTKQLVVSNAVGERLSRAETFLNQQQYDAAIAECDQALHFDPQNTRASSLKDRIAEVKQILGSKR